MRLDVPVRRCRPDDNRVTVIVPPDVSLRSPEEYATGRRQLIPLLDHASGDAIDIGDFGTAKTKGISAARLFLFERIGVACFRPQHRARHCRNKHQAELETPRTSGAHVIPRKLTSVPNPKFVISAATKDANSGFERTLEIYDLVWFSIQEFS